MKKDAVCLYYSKFESHLNDNVFSVSFSAVLSLEPKPVLSNSERGPSHLSAWVRFLATRFFTV